MSRINVIYDGIPFSISDRELSAVKVEIEGALASGTHHWLRVNQGEGSVQPAELLITASTSIALLPIVRSG